MGVCDVPVVSNVCDLAGEAAGTLVTAPFEWVAKAMGQAAGWLFETVWRVIDTTTLVDITSAEYVAVYNLIFGIAVVVTLALASLQLIAGAIKRDPGALHRAGVGLAKSVLGSFVLITITATLLEVVDQLSIGIVQATGSSMEDMGARIAALAAGLAAINVAAPGVGVMLTMFLAGLAIAGALLVWFSLLIRKALLLVAVVMAPLALSGQSWDVTRGWFSRWAIFVLALILSKLIVVIIFLVAVSQVSAPIDADLASVSDPIAGVVLMLAAAFAPYMAYKMISFIGTDLYQSVSTEQEAKSAMNRPVPTASSPALDKAKKVLDNDGDASNAPSAPSPSTSRTKPQLDGPVDPETASTTRSGTEQDTGNDTGSRGKPAQPDSPAAGSTSQAQAGGATSAGGAMAAGAAAGQAVSAGTQTGRAAGSAAEGQHDAASHSEPSSDDTEASRSSSASPSGRTVHDDDRSPQPASTPTNSADRASQGTTTGEAPNRASEPPSQASEAAQVAEPRPTPHTPPPAPPRPDTLADSNDPADE